jgi:hypothetical protein
MKSYFNTEKRCKKYLYGLRNETLCKCGCAEFYQSKKEYELICKNCKLKINAYAKTIFQNVRFGMVKAFNFTLYCHSEHYLISSIKMAKKFSLTQKTAYNFMKKINDNKEFVNQLSNDDSDFKLKKLSNDDSSTKLNKKAQINLEKLQNFLNNAIDH